MKLKSLTILCYVPPCQGRHALVDPFPHLKGEAWREAMHGMSIRAKIESVDQGEDESDEEFTRRVNEIADKHDLELWCCRCYQ